MDAILELPWPVDKPPSGELTDGGRLSPPPLPPVLVEALSPSCSLDMVLVDDLSGSGGIPLRTVWSGDGQADQPCEKLGHSQDTGTGVQASGGSTDGVYWIMFSHNPNRYYKESNKPT